MTKLSPFALVIMPPFWTWSSGLFLTPLATALGSAHPDLVSSAVQCLVFTTSAILSGWVMGQAARGEISPVEPHEMSTSEMLAALREGREQERELAEATREYAKTVPTASTGSLKIILGHNSRAFHFPAGVGVEQLLALAECVGNGNHPTDRALVPPFKRGDGESYQLMRDWMLYGSAHHKAGELALPRTGRGDWTLTDKGMQTLLQWLTSLSPIEGGARAKKARLLLSDAIKKQLSNQKGT